MLDLIQSIALLVLVLALGVNALAWRLHLRWHNMRIKQQLLNTIWRVDVIGAGGGGGKDGEETTPSPVREA